MILLLVFILFSIFEVEVHGLKMVGTYLAFTDSERLIGDAADNDEGACDQENTALSAKRLIGRKFNDTTCAGVWKNDGVEVIANDKGNRTTPAYVAFTDSEHLIGNAAENEAACNPQNTEFDATGTRLIGRKLNDPTRARMWKNDGVEVIANDKGSRTTPSYVAFTDSERLIGDAAEREASCNPENMVFDAKRLIGRKFNDTACAGVWKNDGVEVITNDKGNRTTPAYVAFTDSEYLIGNAAENEAACNPENTEFDARRLIGRKFNDPTRARMWKNDGVEVIANDKGSRTTPSYVAFADSERLIGDVVEDDEAASDPESAVYSAKRLIGCKFNDTACAGVWKNDGVEVIANDKGNRTTPSYVAFTDSERLIGDVAENEAACNPEITVFDTRRLIGRKFNDPTCSGVWKNDGVEVIANDKPSRTTPSYVAFTGSERLIADAVKNDAVCSTENTVLDAKRLIGRKLNEPSTAGAKIRPPKAESGAGDELVTVVNYPGETEKFHAEEVAAVILSKMKELLVQVFEGERAITRDTKLLGKFHLEGIPPASYGVPQVKITFDIDANGDLNMSAKSTGKTNQSTIKDKRCLSQSETDSVVSEANHHAVSDEASKGSVEAKSTFEAKKNELESVVHPIMMTVHQADGGDGASGGLPGSVSASSGVVAASGVSTRSRLVNP